jgi:hypothetical protein
MSEPEGRAGQEAARLVAAAQEWLRTSAPHLAPVGDDGEPCSCPLCRAVVGLREADPDTVARWVDTAVTGVSAALAAVAATAGSGAGADDDDGDDGAEEQGPPGATGESAGDRVDDPGVGHDGPGGRRVRRITLDDGPAGEAPG